MFRLDQISFRIPQRTLLFPTSFTFDAGKVYGLIGHNGSGKSTLIKLMARQTQLSGGSISLDGKDIVRWNQREFAKRVAYLPQHLPAATNLTARELIGMGRYAWNGLFGRQTAADKQAIAEALHLTHTEKFADQLVDTLSGGERSRIWLAMLLAQQVEVMQLVHQLSRDLGLGVVIVIHDINLAARFCDHLVALHSGKLLVQGDAQQIVNPPSLEAIYGIRLNVIPHPQTQRPVSFY
ncbi:TPA: ABC transporter ATP-binding protein [Haemophilus influenzae]|uniref:ABC transporter ATP-binding protein n=1 Tax=Haemophilus influenzae TaxID=727 RepID=UPI000E597215|nr:ATP-binding cassette domain-containing protein [Haemophilus influenzae]